MSGGYIHHNRMTKNPFVNSASVQSRSGCSRPNSSLMTHA